MNDWLIDAAELLAQADPGPTPWLVEELIVDRAIVACAGRWKTTKSYGLLHLCISIATGEPAFGTYAIPEPGPVVYIIEESGEAALWRRLDALCRGRAIDPERLRGRLLLSANKRVKLDDEDWQQRLLEVGHNVRPRLFAFDPLARMKAPARNESAQNEMAVPIEFLRLLRDEADAATLFVQHLGHQGESMRGSSDLESVWETRLGWKREGQSPLITLSAEHREAEGDTSIKYRIGWDADTRSMRFDLDGAEKADDLAERVHAYLREHPDASANDVADNIDGRRKTILTLVRSFKEGGSQPTGTTGNHPSTGTPEGGSPGPPFRGPGTTIRAPGSNGREPPPFDQVELDYLDTLYDPDEAAAR